MAKVYLCPLPFHPFENSNDNDNIGGGNDDHDEHSTRAIFH